MRNRAGNAGVGVGCSHHAATVQFASVCSGDYASHFDPVLTLLPHRPQQLHQLVKTASRHSVMFVGHMSQQVADQQEELVVEFAEKAPIRARLLLLCSGDPVLFPGGIQATALPAARPSTSLMTKP